MLLPEPKVQHNERQILQIVGGDVFGTVARSSTAVDREPELIVRSIESLRNSFLSLHGSENRNVNR
jgi:hypothetical protein